MLVGLSGDFGTITAGRQYTPLHGLEDTYDPTGQGIGSGYNSGIISGFARINSSVVYSTPALGSFSASVMVSLGETTGSGPRASARAPTASQQPDRAVVFHALPRQAQHQGLQLRLSQRHVLQRDIARPRDSALVQAPRRQPHADAVMHE